MLTLINNRKIRQMLEYELGVEPSKEWKQKIEQEEKEYGLYTGKIDADYQEKLQALKNERFQKAKEIVMNEFERYKM